MYGIYKGRDVPDAFIVTFKRAGIFMGKIQAALIFRVQKVNSYHIMKLIDARKEPFVAKYDFGGLSFPCPGYMFFKENTTFVNCMAVLEENESKSLSESLSGWPKYYYLERLRSNNSLFMSAVRNEEELEQYDELFSEYQTQIEDISFIGNIELIYRRLCQAVIGQDAGIKELITAIYKNEILKNEKFPLDFIARNKQNILICGPTGTGKTEVIRRISRYLRVPFIIEDATRYTEAGYMGEDVDDLVRNLYIKSGKDINKTESGIIILDEIDKLAVSTDHRGSVSTKSVQQALLKLIEGEEINIKLNHRDTDSRITIDTSRITFIGLGAFTGIEILSQSSKPEEEHFTAYGMIPELMGRLSSIIAFNSLTEADLVNILKKSTISPLLDYELFFRKLNIEINYDDDFISYIAKKAIDIKKGARSLKKELDKFLTPYSYDVFSNKINEINLYINENS